jgi:hypothetical protein
MCWDEAWEEESWLIWAGLDRARRAEPGRPLVEDEAEAAVGEALAVLRAGSPRPSLRDVVRSLFGHRSEPQPEPDLIDELLPAGRR